MTNGNGHLFPPPAQWTAGTKVFAYLRDSGGREQELSIDRQIGEIKAWVEEYGLIVTQWFSESRSARTAKKREQLQVMMEALRNGAEVGGIVVWSYDRFARNAIQSQLYRSEIRDRGYNFHSLTDYIPDGSEAVVFEAFRDYAAEQFSVTLSRNVKSGARAVLKTHGVLGGFPPKGFMRERVEIGVHRDGRQRIGHRWVPDPDLAPTIRLAFDMRAQGATLKQIMQATGLFKSKNSFTTFFTNRLYMGILEYGDLVIEDYCEPIVPAALWERAYKLGQQRASISGKKHNPRRHASQFVFSGVVFCQHCGAPMNGRVVAKKGKPRRLYYVCSRAHRRFDCPARFVPARPLETILLKKLEDVALDLENLLAFQAKVKEHYARMYHQLDGERLRLRRQLRDQTKRIGHLIDAISERGHSRSLLDALHKAELEEASLKIQVEDLEREMQIPREASPKELAALAEELKSALHGEDLSKKKNAIHMLTNRIIVSRTDEHIRGVLHYIPNVCVGNGTPARTRTVLFGSGGRRSVH